MSPRLLKDEKGSSPSSKGGGGFKRVKSMKVQGMVRAQALVIFAVFEFRERFFQFLR
jgi:hypothetical protein